MKQKPTSIYGKILCYEQRRRIAVKICQEHDMLPTRDNLISVMGKDYYKLERAYREFRDFKAEEESKPTRKKVIDPEG